MASIFKRRLKDGKGFSWRAIVRLKGYPTVCESFERKQEADDWAADTERKIKSGQFKFDQYKTQHTYNELVAQFLSDGALEHHKSADDTKRHLEYWKMRLGEYALVHLTPERIGKERQHLLDSPSMKGKQRSKATVNRYMSSLSSTLRYATEELRWISENPCKNLTKLKEHAGRDRVLTEYEIPKLLLACKESLSPYLYCTVLIAITTGARQGEILNLEWRDIDFENKLAHLRETKNGRPRSISLADPVIDELKKLFEQRNPQKPLVFASKTAFGKTDLKKAWKKALTRAGIAHCRPHDMRHTFATMAATQGASNIELATALGHRTLQMTQRYTHLDAKSTKKYSDTISEKILQGDLS